MEYSILDMLMKGKENADNPNVFTDFYDLTQIRFAYQSGKLAGLRLSEEEVEIAYYDKNGKIKQYDNGMITLDDIQETRNHFNCFAYLMEHIQDEVTEELLKDCHRLLKKETHSGKKNEAGNYKQKPNMAGTWKTTPPEKVEVEMEKILLKYKGLSKRKMEDVFQFHTALVKISPFLDGNGRIARLILFKECLKHDITPVIVGIMQKSKYFHAIREGEENNRAITDLCEQSQERYKSLIPKSIRYKWG